MMTTYWRARVGWHEGGRMFRAMCGCGWMGTAHVDTVAAAAEVRAHVCP